MRVIYAREDGSAVRVWRHKAGNSETLKHGTLDGLQSSPVTPVPSSLKLLAPVLKVGGSSVRKDTPVGIRLEAGLFKSFGLMLAEWMFSLIVSL